MKLELTTKRAIEYEEKTGKDILEFLQEVSKTGKLTIKEVVDLFSAMGEKYTLELFDSWELPLTDKIIAIVEAIKDYAQGKKA